MRGPDRWADTDTPKRARTPHSPWTWKHLQPKFFTLGNGFSLMWPIGDYRTLKNGRIEGVGVTPDITVPADKALEVALSQ